MDELTNNAILAIKNELQSAGVKVVEFEDPILGAKGSIVVAPEGWQKLHLIDPKKVQFPQKVSVLDVSSFCRYLKEFGSPESIVLSNEGGMLGVVDYYDADKTPLRRTHTVCLPAGWSPDTVKQIGAIKAALGKTLNLDAFEMLIQTAALIVRDSITLLEIINDLEGTSAVKVTRTRTGQTASLTGNVKNGKDIEIPKSIRLTAAYMGEIIEAELPFRCSVVSEQINFQIIDNGALDAAMVGARKAVVAKVSSEVLPIAVYEGSI